MRGVCLPAGARDTPEEDSEEEALSSRAKRFALLNPMPNTNKELAILIRDVIGARPKYGDESARPTCWPADVPWLKGKSISQVREGFEETSKGYEICPRNDADSIGQCLVGGLWSWCPSCSARRRVLR